MTIGERLRRGARETPTERVSADRNAAFAELYEHTFDAVYRFCRLPPPDRRPGRGGGRRRPRLRQLLRLLSVAGHSLHAPRLCWWSGMVDVGACRAPHPHESPRRTIRTTAGSRVPFLARPGRIGTFVLARIDRHMRLNGAWCIGIVNPAGDPISPYARSAVRRTVSRLARRRQYAPPGAECHRQRRWSSPARCRGTLARRKPEMAFKLIRPPDPSSPIGRLSAPVRIPAARRTFLIASVIAVLLLVLGAAIF